jgi:hypothetical protein
MRVKRNTAFRRRSIIATLLIGTVAVLGILYASRVRVRDAYERLTAPTLPAEETFKTTEANNVPDVIVPHVTTSTAEEPSDDGATSTSSEEVSIPLEKQLAVPFMSQAPLADWDPLHEEACEEASVLMVRGYYQGESGRYDPNEAEDLIQDLVRFQTDHYGFFEDTSATETVRFAEAAFPELEGHVYDIKNPDSVKRWIAEGFPVIIPADGKTLPNPNFRNGGPKYHMLVVRGYTGDQFITNDPGTRKGENFLYTYHGLLDAAHDWNGGDVPNGRRVMIVLSPRSP